MVQRCATEAGADAAVISNHWAKGGAGAVKLAEALVRVCESGDSEFKVLYPDHISIEEKITTVAKEIYGADGVELSELARKQMETYTKQGYGNLPSKICLIGQERAPLNLLAVCMAKTQYSFSHDPKLKGVPSGRVFFKGRASAINRKCLGFTIPVRAIRLSAGAGFLYPILGDMQTMPGLGTRPGFWEVGLDDSGKVVGLF